MHCKLSKLANLCKDLNDESAVRHSQALVLQNKLDAVTAERDQMTEDVVRLQAQVKAYEKQQEELEATKERLRQVEDQGLSSANRAVQERDHVIADLASKLERALDQLDLERAHRQRRQIIFPAETVGSPLQVKL
jgi:DNA repair exonuclease SbcCD ATPase subunit